MVVGGGEGGWWQGVVVGGDGYMVVAVVIVVVIIGWESTPMYIHSFYKSLKMHKSTLIIFGKPNPTETSF